MGRGFWDKGHTISSSEAHKDLEALRNKSDIQEEVPGASVGDLQGAGEKGIAPQTGCDMTICTAVHKGGAQPPSCI